MLAYPFITSGTETLLSNSNDPAQETHLVLQVRQRTIGNKPKISSTEKGVKIIEIITTLRSECLGKL